MFVCYISTSWKWLAEIQGFSRTLSVSQSVCWCVGSDLLRSQHVAGSDPLVKLFLGEVAQLHRHGLQGWTFLMGRLGDDGCLVITCRGGERENIYISLLFWDTPLRYCSVWLPSSGETGEASALEQTEGLRGVCARFVHFFTCLWVILCLWVCVCLLMFL